jgi:transcriptional regulator with XRE-family HTH domain
MQLHDARMERRLSLAQIADRAGLSAASAAAAEAGRAVSLEVYVRLATALGLRSSLLFETGRSSTTAAVRIRDVVHSAMGEAEAGHFAAHGLRVAIDEPYQHYQFAGRADFLAWNVDERRLLHIENKSRLDDIRDVAGAYNAKRAYLAAALSDRLGVGPRGWCAVSHVLAVLWSSEVLHTLRTRSATFAAICPDPSDAVDAWWTGRAIPDGVTSALIVFDPATNLGRARCWTSFEAAVASARPRYRDYADAVRKLSRR